MAKRNKNQKNSNNQPRKGDIIRGILAELPRFNAAANAAFDLGAYAVALEYIGVIELLEATIAFLSDCTQAEFAGWLADEEVREAAEIAEDARQHINEWIA